jgi:trk system potassium uptake protein TrkA
MRIILVGYGRVGRRTARILRDEDHDVVIVDVTAERVERARAAGFESVEGDGGRESVLLEAGLEAADAIAGLTGDLNANFAACVVGDEHGCRTVLRVDEDVSDRLYERYAEAADEVIYPERLGAAGAKTALIGGDFGVVAELAEQLVLASVTVEAGPLVGERVADVELPGNTRVYAHGRPDEQLSIPLPGTRLEVGDSVGVVVDPDRLAEVRSLLHGNVTA